MQVARAAQITPYRIHAVVRLVAQLQPIPHDKLKDLLQPSTLKQTQKAFDEIIRAARYLELIVDADKGIELHDAITDTVLADFSAFRHYISKTMLGITDPKDDNYVFNLFTAWYATQDDRVFRFRSLPELTARFNKAIGTEAGERAFNPDKFRGWLSWAQFFGWGYPFQSILMPDATLRVEETLPKLISQNERLTLHTFLERLLIYCPELDGGELYRLIQKQSGDLSGQNRLSLMLSIALRALHERGRIGISHIADSGAMWQLFPGTQQPQSTITHITGLSP